MEGYQCNQTGCRTRDFLPFLCPHCDQLYCLEHRSKYSHNCSGNLSGDNNAIIDNSASVTTNEGTASTPGNISVRSLFEGIEKRFDNSAPSTTSKVTEHPKPVSTGVPGAKGQLSGTVLNTVEKLELKWDEHLVEGVLKRSFTEFHIHNATQKSKPSTSIWLFV